jgi:MoaA/NifB/PqqE/SkfB family radical SAM enzyme/alpha-beta hydrolase superfamily lysophospholipase
MSAGIILVHGYTGSPVDLSGLAKRMTLAYGDDAVAHICLPGHDTGDIPPFDAAALTDSVSTCIRAYASDNRSVILLGHSTGGTLLLSALSDCAVSPALLILASVPKKIDSSYIERWHVHRSGKANVPFISVAKMISLINSVGSRDVRGDFPVLFLQGEDDDLVPVTDFNAWKESEIGCCTRSVMIPSATHNVFQGDNALCAIDAVMRAVSDALAPRKEEEIRRTEKLLTIENELNEFLTRSPLSGPHIAGCPGVQVLDNAEPLLTPLVDHEPVLANIEITARCNLRCTYCARSLRNRQEGDMPLDRFRQILDLLPHAYRVTFVGLGEPLLHPHIIDFIEEAVSRGRRTAVVTNAMTLNGAMSREMIRAGLHAIAFSIDSPDQDMASAVRHGSDIDTVKGNIKRFIELSESTRPLSTAVFSAVSVQTAPYLEQLIDIVKDLGVRVLMLTDLNFPHNVRNTLWKNADESTVLHVQKAVSHAFSKGLPVLTVRALEEFGMAERYRNFLLIPPGKLYDRSARHTWCYSPWQTVPVDVNGNITICDCQPEKVAGNLLTQPFTDIWNGEVMRAHRERMRGDNPPPSCRICPRF